LIGCEVSSSSDREWTRSVPIRWPSFAELSGFGLSL
jgi:hypothetical protein